MSVIVNGNGDTNGHGDNRHISMSHNNRESNLLIEDLARLDADGVEETVTAEDDVITRTNDVDIVEDTHHFNKKWNVAKFSCILTSHLYEKDEELDGLRDDFHRLLRKAEGVHLTHYQDKDKDRLVTCVMVDEEKLMFQSEVHSIQFPIKDTWSGQSEEDKVQALMTHDEIEEEGSDSYWTRFKELFESDQEVDYISAPFRWDKRHLFAGIDDPDTFFRSALRSFLTHHILIRTDVSKKKDISDGINIRGLNYLVHKGVYTDVFILHDRPSTLHRRLAFKSKDDDQTIVDPRQELWDSWKKWYQFQPLWKIRNYFGEKIAFYFAWIGLYTASLIVPSLLGIISLIYGINYDTTKIVNAATSNSTVSEKFYEMFTTFNNPITPWFALILCIWGTFFVEQWKRKSNSLKYEWDVSNFEQLEPDRPQFYGINKRSNPITNEEEWYYPFYRMYLKLTVSVASLLFMVIVVIMASFGVIIFRCASTNQYWFEKNATTPVFDEVTNTTSYTTEDNYNSLYASFVSSVLNAVTIMLLGRAYEYLAYWLTDWENHRTQTGYDDALIIKLFTFQFVNNYAALFYIAFWKTSAATSGLFGREAWKDTCDYKTQAGDVSCMPMLVMQVAVLLILKPCPKFFNDVVLPYLIQLYRMFKRRFKAGDTTFCCCPPCCCSCFRGDIEKIDEGPVKNKELIDIIEEDRKLIAGDKDFTLSEYTEKCIMYGMVMLFGAAFPLAPLVAMICNLVDIRIDAHRLLWENRRYIAQRAEDIGIWQYILEFLNMIGVITNSLLIAFTMKGNGSVTDDWFDNPWLCAFAFEHIVFTIKFVVSYVIPDIPSDVRFKMRKEQYQVNMLFDDSLRKDVKAEQEKAAADAATADAQI